MIDKSKYKLRAMIVHKGKSVKEGHYFTVSMDEDRLVVLDDDRVFQLQSREKWGFYILGFVKTK